MEKRERGRVGVSLLSQEEFQRERSDDGEEGHRRRRRSAGHLNGRIAVSLSIARVDHTPISVLSLFGSALRSGRSRRHLDVALVS